MITFLAIALTISAITLAGAAVHSWADAMQQRPTWPDYAHDAQVDAWGFAVIALFVNTVAISAWLE